MFSDPSSNSNSPEHEPYVLRLFVAGTSPNSARAVANLTRFCEEHLAGVYEIEVVDLYQQPALAKEEQIVAVPTLVKKLPPPMRRVVGDLADQRKLLASFGFLGGAA